MVVLRSFTTPMLWSLMLLALGLILTHQTRRRDPKPRLSMRVGRFLLLLGLMLLIALSLAPVANLLTYPLESRYPPPSAEALGTLDVVAVLGGGVRPSDSFRPEAELTVHSYPRFYRGVQVFRQTNAGLLAFCAGADRTGEESEGETMKTMALRLGIPAERILAETQSQNTFENIANLARMLPAGQGRRIGLVTSAIHMWRSHRVCAQQFPHDTIVPIPAYYAYEPTGWSVRSFLPSAGNIERSTMALHEWIGLVWYSLRHR
jgi:uncharacterized SAM-binding protein YcdF (DUF218 family)